ncbi:magnesium transporter [Proteinivorax tanatarense]|uniref:Magnesium transporter MgtE n=1 Tax=Proteinivorax tanatarense TaxID=1260629 RepID=A0AAU7VNL9_9FIRM
MKFQKVLELLNNNEISTLKDVINSYNSLDINSIIDQLEGDKKAVVFRLLNKDNAISAFELMDIDNQQQILALLTDERANEFVNELEPDDRAKLLDELPAKVANRLMSSLSKEERDKTANILGYEPETAGRIMNPNILKLNGTMTVTEAVKKIKERYKDIEDFHFIFVTDKKRKLVGYVSLMDVIVADKEDKIEDVMEPNVYSVYTSEDQEKASRLLQKADLIELPVVDKEGRLLGVITADDAMEVLENEATEDIFEKAGLTTSDNEVDRSKRMINGTVLQIWKVRLPFLIITLIGGLTAGAVIGSFEETLEAIAAVAIFIPVVMDMGGNVGTQSSTIFTRALILGQIDRKRFSKHFAKEVGIGASMGMLLGIVTGVIAEVWQQIPGIGFAVGIALALTVTLATALGFAIPFLLNKLGFDQAAGSDPIITTIKDISGLAIYFFLVTHFLGH